MAMEIYEHDLQFRNHAYNHWVVDARVAEGHTIDRVLQPSFWKNATRNVKVGDLIEVRADDGKFELTARVVRKANGELHLREMSRWEGEVPTISATAIEYRVEWGGPHHKHRVVRIEEGKPDEIVKHGFDDKGSAESWVAQHRGAPAQIAA